MKPLRSESRRLAVTALASSLVMVLSGVAGYKLSGSAVAQGLLGSLSTFAEPLVKLPPPLLAGFIFLNNAIKGLLSIVLGPAFGLFPLVFLVSNGIILGLVTAKAYEMGGLALPIVSLAPHGIIELGAVVLCASLGLQLGVETLSFLAGHPSRLREQWRSALRLYLVVALPLLLVAAVIEATVTSALIKAIR